MVVSVQHFNEITNGYEKTTSGLWTHKGKLDASSLRGTGSDPPRTGTGVEVGYYAVGPYGYISALDRDANQYKDLNIQARNITLLTTGGTLNLPAGSVDSSEIADGAVTTAKLATGAATQMIATFAGDPAAWSTTTTGQWINTTVAATGTVVTGSVLVMASAYFNHSVGSGSYYYGLSIDSGAQQLIGIGVGTAAIQCTWWHATPTAGSHTFALCAYNVTAGTLSLNSGVRGTLYAIEFRR
jgi:hypothetical protein